MISVIILTKNEEINIQRCLESVSWSDDVLVLDSGSTDRTVEIAKNKSARVLNRPFDNFANQRNFALDQCDLRHDWVLHLDADEEVTPELRDELLEISSRKDHGPYSAYRVASRIMLKGSWIRRAGMYPAYQVRFGKICDLRFKMVGHGQREDLNPDRIGTLNGDLIHHNFSKGLDDWLSRHQRYARDEGVEILRNGRFTSLKQAIQLLFQAQGDTEQRRAFKLLAGHLPCRPFLRFLYVYVFSLGFLDGAAGLTYARLMLQYQKMIDQELDHLRRHH